MDIRQLFIDKNGFFLMYFYPLSIARDGDAIRWYDGDTVLAPADVRNWISGKRSPDDQWSALLRGDITQGVQEEWSLFR